MKTLLLITSYMKIKIPLFWRTRGPNRWCNFFFKSRLFKEQLNVHRNIEGKISRFSIFPSFCTWKVSPIINILYQSGTFFTLDEPTLKHYNHAKSTVYILAHS